MWEKLRQSTLDDGKATEDCTNRLSYNFCPIPPDMIAAHDDTQYPARSAVCDPT